MKKIVHIVFLLAFSICENANAQDPYEVVADVSAIEQVLYNALKNRCVYFFNEHSANFTIHLNGESVTREQLLSELIEFLQLVEEHGKKEKIISDLPGKTGERFIFLLERIKKANQALGEGKISGVERFFDGIKISQELNLSALFRNSSNFNAVLEKYYWKTRLSLDPHNWIYTIKFRTFFRLNFLKLLESQMVDLKEKDVVKFFNDILNNKGEFQHFFGEIRTVQLQQTGVNETNIDALHEAITRVVRSEIIAIGLAADLPLDVKVPRYDKRRVLLYREILESEAARLDLPKFRVLSAIRSVMVK